jgi:hypothetical protein
MKTIAPSEYPQKSPRSAKQNQSTMLVTGDSTEQLDQPIPQAKLIKSNPLSRKLQQILSSGSLDDATTQTALNSLLPLLAPSNT